MHKIKSNCYFLDDLRSCSPAIVSFGSHKLTNTLCRFGCCYIDTFNHEINSLFRIGLQGKYRLHGNHKTWVMGLLCAHWLCDLVRLVSFLCTPRRQRRGHHQVRQRTRKAHPLFLQHRLSEKRQTFNVSTCFIPQYNFKARSLTHLWQRSCQVTC